MPHVRPVLMALLGLMLLAPAARAADLNDCNAAVAVPTGTARPLAQAYWLDARTMQWPGLVLQPGEKVRLHHARAAG
ncbi:MAG TPA: hypothetical protein VN201_10450, partial [Roseateles sp.]|nr:hypothetical protein [Roseateles sp.]